MAKVIPVITDFTRGELSPKMEGRSDSEAFFQGVSELQNMIVQPQGGVTKRPGTIYFSEVQNTAKVSRLIPFVVDESTVFVLEFYDGGIRVIGLDDGAPILVDSTFLLTINSAPAGGDWPAGTIIEGTSSGATAAVLKKVTNTSYQISEPSDDFTDGEDIVGEDSDGDSNTATGWAGEPTVTETTGVTNIVQAQTGVTFHAEADLPSLRYVQAGFQMAFACPNVAPRVLTYMAPTGWIWDAINFAVPPWQGAGDLMQAI